MAEDFNVNFPSEMKVYSPEIKAIETATKTIANVLHNDLKAMIKPLEHLTALEDLMKELSTDVVNQFTNLFTRQIEGTILARQANISILENKINYVGRHISSKKKHLDDTVEKVADRYESLSEDLAKEHEFFLSELDSHAYEILDNFFQKQVQDKFSLDSMPPLDYLNRHASQAAIARTDCLNEGLNEAVKSVENFQYVRNEFYSLLETLSIEDVEEGSYSLPYYYLKVSDNETGEEKIIPVFPWSDSNENLPDDKNFISEAIAENIDSTSKKLTKKQVEDVYKALDSEQFEDAKLLKQYVERDLLNNAE